LSKCKQRENDQNGWIDRAIGGKGIISNKTSTRPEWTLIIQAKRTQERIRRSDPCGSSSSPSIRGKPKEEEKAVFDLVILSSIVIIDGVAGKVGSLDEHFLSCIEDSC
jgi:hypothetical protein